MANALLERRLRWSGGHPTCGREHAADRLLEAGIVADLH